MRGAAVAGAVGSFWKVEEVGLVGGEVEEGSPGEHEPGELGREAERGLWEGGSPAPAYGTESEVVGIDGELFGDCFDDLSW